MVKKLWRYVKPFSSDTGTLQTDRQTDLLHQNRASVCWHAIKTLTRPRTLPGPWTITWSKQYLSAMHPVTCSLLWVRCLFDRLSFEIFRLRHPDYDPDRAHKLISSSMSRHLSTRKISSKPCTRFWVILLSDRQTDRQTSRAIAFTSSFVRGKKISLCKR